MPELNEQGAWWWGMRILESCSSHRSTGRVLVGPQIPLKPPNFNVRKGGIHTKMLRRKVIIYFFKKLLSCLCGEQTMAGRGRAKNGGMGVAVMRNCNNPAERKWWLRPMMAVEEWILDF